MHYLSWLRQVAGPPHSLQMGSMVGLSSLVQPPMLLQVVQVLVARQATVHLAQVCLVEVAR